MKSIYAALIKLQSELPIVTKDSKGYNWKYAKLEDIVEATRDLLAKNKLCIFHVVGNENGQDILITVLAHDSGETIESRMTIKQEKEELKAYGAALSYLKRYAYMSIIGLVTEESDQVENTAWKNKPNTVPQGNTISKELEDVLWDEIGHDKDIARQLVKHYQITRLNMLPADKFKEAQHNIKNIKKTKQEIRS